MEFKKGLDIKRVDGTGLRVGIVRARWNDKIISALVSGAKQALKEANVKESDIVGLCLLFVIGNKNWKFLEALNCRLGQEPCCVMANAML